MGQKSSTVKENTSEISQPKIENLKDGRESLNATESKLGINVIEKDAKMSMKMESFIIDTIVLESVKHSSNELALSIKTRY